MRGAFGQGASVYSSGELNSETAAVIFGMSGLTLTQDEVNFFTDINPYGFILFARNIESKKQVQRLVGTLQELLGRDRLPILIDQEGGRVARLKPPVWSAYPAAAVFANMAHSSRQRAERAVYLNARLIAHDLHELGITVDCAPLADLPVKGAHDVIGDRAFGHESDQVVALCRAMAQGLMDGGIVPVLKHIPGHGRACADSHCELPVVDAPLDLLRKTDFMPFSALADLPMGMTAHVLYTGIDRGQMATVSRTVIALIRDEIGFNGLLMSDDLSMKAMSGDFTERAQAVLAAGCDVVLHCNGDMQEMQAIAEGVCPLEGVPLARAESAMNAVKSPAAFNAEAARRELANFMRM